MSNALTAGSRVGPYEIIGPLGAGGMGEVYRARDTRLRRDVALKVLPADVAGDAARRARFEQEAHAAAALNHPNILGIHDIGTDGAVFYMATELVNGETLAAVIERGPVSIRVLLDIAAQIADDLISYGGTPQPAWMPDNRHVVLALQTAPDAAMQLWLADTVTDERHPLTSGTTNLHSPSIAPDGRRLIAAEGSGTFDVVSVDLATASARALIASERNELMPAWSAADPTLVYGTDRSGPFEIWVHRPDGADRPVATARDFSAGGTQWFIAPAPSPKGDRVIYTRIERGTTARLWISSIAGGTPIQLTNDDAAEFPGSWSPDGAYFAYYALRDGKANLMKVKTTGQAAPVLLRPATNGTVPAWSPAGDWIVHGSELVSPDGKTTKELADHRTPCYTFSQDGKLLYGLRLENDRQVLYSIEIATGAEKVIGTLADGFTPGSNLSPSLRFSLAPDGKSFVYGSGTFTTNLWMLEGFAKTKSRFAGLLH